MEENINIAEILKDKPQGTKLYSILSDGECFLNEASEDSIYIDIDNRKRFWCFSAYGSTYSFPNGCVLLFPSKEMRDWSKFAWKRGDVLVYRNFEEFYYTIFEGFQDDEYTQFRSRYCNNSENRWLQSKVGITNLFTKVSDEEAKRFIKKIEECYNGKLNLDTLEIEKTQPEFKIGDILFVKYNNRNIIFILSNINRKFYTHRVRLDSNKVIINYSDSHFQNEGIEFIRYATEGDKQQLFDALAKEGKRWDSEKKAIVDLKPKVDELKPFDKVLVRDSESDKWRANLFGYIDKDEYYHCVYANWVYCIPYEGNEHLLGTTKDVED